MKAIASELACLTPLVGAWETTSHTEPSVLGPAVMVTSIDKFTWMDGGHFLVQNYRTQFGDEPVRAGLNYWFFDEAIGRLRIISFANTGPYSESGNQYDSERGPGTLTFTGPARFQFTLDANGVVQLNDDRTLTVRWWLRNEAGIFQPWMRNVSHRM